MPTTARFRTNTGLTQKETTRITTLSTKHHALIHECGKALATNFDVPARDTIAMYCSQMGISRRDWDKIRALEFDNQS